MSQPGICTFCFANIICATTSWGYHHATYSSLTKSARQRCAFCVLLDADVRKYQDVLWDFACRNRAPSSTIQHWLSDSTTGVESTVEFGRTTSLYRWSVRTLGRTSETNSTVAVTFRIIPQPTTSVDGDETTADLAFETFGLPERVFYCFPESDLGSLLSLAKLGTSTNPDINEGHQIRSWIRTCGIEHKHCPKRLGAGMKFIPTRLLHVGRGRRGDPVRVVDTKANKIKGPYVTLSHCWGADDGDRKDTLTSSNFAEFHERGVPWQCLCLTFKEAIEVARFLEVDYIWIDSLCIIQGGDKVSKEDWEREGCLMHKVYRNSYCNIASADAPNSKSGLFRHRKARDVFSAKFESDGTSPMFGERVWRAVREDLWDDGLLQRPLYQRGWVFQERMLAPRILHFSRHQIFWDCAAMSACETLPDGLPLPLDRESATDRHWRGRLQEAGTNAAILVTAENDESLDDFWGMAVANYTSLNLTFQTDKRRALWGIAKLVRDGLHRGYAAGMWADKLEEQLAWRVADYTVAERPQELTINPSWAWSSVKGKIILQGTVDEERIYRVTDPEGQPLSFRTTDQNVRPAIARDDSSSYGEQVAAMGRELELVEERRRKSSASSRHNSQGTLFSTRHNSQVDIPSSRNSSVARSLDLGARNTLVSTTWTMSPQQMILDPDDEDRSARNSQTTTRQNSAVTSLKSQDTEPELADKKIAVLGYIRQGILKFDKITVGWTVKLPSDTQLEDGENLIEAFPDVKPKGECQTIIFLILALSEQVEETDNYSDDEDSEPVQTYWFNGHGILLQPTGDENCYARIGSISVNYLTLESWIYIQEGNKAANGTVRKGKFEPQADSFFLV